MSKTPKPPTKVAAPIEIKIVHQEREPIVPLELTPEQKQQWGDTMSLMAWTAPGFRHLFYKLLSNNNGAHIALFTDAIPTAATDAKNILINPEWFFKLSLKERVFVTAHEIVHNVYSDVEMLHRITASGKVPMDNGTTLPFDNDTAQKAMDYRINALLVDSKIGSMPSQGCYDVKIATSQDGFATVYKKLYDDDKSKGNGKAPGGFDLVLAPGASTGQNPQTAAGQRSAQQWAVEVAVAQTLEQMRSQGKMAGSLSRMFQEILEPEVPWVDHIRTIMSRKVGSGSYDWRKPDRRFIVRDLHMPGRSGFGAGWLVVWGDTSGSIGQKELCSYIAELSAIVSDIRPKRLTLLWCDAKIHFVDDLQEGDDLEHVKSRGVGGGGGTSVAPVFDWIKEQHSEPDMLLCFTDGYVSFLKEPPFPVIWASTTDVKYPYGEVVKINRKGA